LKSAEDGSVILRSGEVDYGQGSDTIFCQIVAEELGIRYDSIQLITADTFTTPNAGPTSASRLTYVTGNAVLKAARTLRITFGPLQRTSLMKPISSLQTRRSSPRQTRRSGSPFRSWQRRGTSGAFP